MKYPALNGLDVLKENSYNLRKSNFNTLEKTYSIAGMILGGLGTIWATKEIIDVFTDSKLISWTGSAFLNLFTFGFYPLISPLFYGAGIGKAFGDILAYNSREKRKKSEKTAKEKKGLEKITKKK